MKIFLLTMLLSIAATVNGCCTDSTCTCEPNCWEKCFVSSPNSLSYKKAYEDIYRMAVGIRNLYAPCYKPHGTAFMMDSAVPGSNPSGLFQYQRDLATIIAMSQPVGDDCNPFTASKYFRNYGYYSHSWPCKSSCEAYKLFQEDSSMRYYQRDSSTSWVNGGEILSDLAFKRPHLRGHECMKCSSNELLIAFSNSMMRNVPSSYCNPGRYHCAVVGVNPAPYSNMNTWANSGVYEMSASNTYKRAASIIRSCMYSSCCRHTVTWWKPQRLTKGREVDEEEAELHGRASAASKQTFEIRTSGPSAGKIPTTFTGSFTDLSKKLSLVGDDIISDRPICKGRNCVRPKAIP